jgi:purine-binding chemotaxis protein CheW
MKDDKTILQERAKSIAGRNKTVGEADGSLISVVEFLLKPERYAIEEKYISEVLFLKDIAPIPGTPPFVMGVINLRGRIVTVVNLKSLFRLKEKGLTDLNKVIVIQNENMEFGIVSDVIVGSKTIDTGRLCEPPLTLHGDGAEFISGVTSDGLILLNTVALLSGKTIDI